MNMNVKWLIPAALAVGLIGGLWLGTTRESQAQVPALEAEESRYEITVIGEGAAVLLDTWTGRTWSFGFAIRPDGPEWYAMDRQDNPGPFEDIAPPGRRQR